MSKVLSNTAFTHVLVSLKLLSFEGSCSLLPLPPAPLSLLPVQALSLSPIPLGLLTHLQFSAIQARSKRLRSVDILQMSHSPENQQVN